jgi:hypothetical protein
MVGEVRQPSNNAAQQYRFESIDGYAVIMVVFMGRRPGRDSTRTQENCGAPIEG